MNTIPGLGLHLPSDWDTATLDEVTSKIGSGATPRGGASVYVDSGPVLIRSQNVHDHDFKTAGLVCLSPEAAASLRGVTVEPGDVLINITGDSILRTALVPDSVLPARVNQHVAIVRSNGTVDPLFLQKWLCLPLMKDYMLGHSSGGTRKAITKGHLQSFPIPLPPIEEQRAIAATLGALDDKIESNRRAIETLDKIASARVDNYVAHADSSQLRELECLGRLVTGKTPSTKDEGNFGGSIPFVTIAELSAQHVIQQSARTLSNAGAELVKGAVVPAGSIAISCIATVGECGIIGTEAVTNQQINTLIPDPSVISTGFAYYLFRTLKKELLAIGGGGSVYTNVSKGRLSKIKVAVPPMIEQEGMVPSSFIAEILHLQEESRQLSTLRSTLLPELLSGRIRAADVEIT